MSSFYDAFNFEVKQQQQQKQIRRLKRLQRGSSHTHTYKYIHTDPNQSAAEHMSSTTTTSAMTTADPAPSPSPTAGVLHFVPPAAPPPYSTMLRGVLLVGGVAIAQEVPWAVVRWAVVAAGVTALGMELQFKRRSAAAEAAAKQFVLGLYNLPLHLHLCLVGMAFTADKCAVGSAAAGERLFSVVLGGTLLASFCFSYELPPLYDKLHSTIQPQTSIFRSCNLTAVKLSSP
eukprot:gene3739-2635_t